MRITIEKYYIDGNGQPNVQMSSNTASILKEVIKAYENGIGQSSFGTAYKMRAAGKFIAENYLEDDAAKKFLEENDAMDSYLTFLNIVKIKIANLSK